jgi:hypothetical protein
MKRCRDRGALRPPPLQQLVLAQYPRLRDAATLRRQGQLRRRMSKPGNGRELRGMSDGGERQRSGGRRANLGSIHRSTRMHNKRHVDMLLSKRQKLGRHEKRSTRKRVPKRGGRKKRERRGSHILAHGMLMELGLRWMTQVLRRGNLRHSVHLHRRRIPNPQCPHLHPSENLAKFHRKHPRNLRKEK